ncbi:MAG: ASKHA domain-containing protein [Longimicrobiales bacterium]
MKIDVAFQPLGLHVEVEPGTTALEAAQEAGVGISAICGGLGSCDACRVRLGDQGQVSQPNEIEREALGTDGLAQGIRLACQVEIYGTLRVEVPAESMTATQRTQVEGLETAFEFDPAVKVLDLTLPSARTDDLQADFERLSAAVSEDGRSGLECRRLSILSRIPELLRENGWRVRVGIRGSELVSVDPPGTPVLGMAVDIGTTKVAGYLVDMATGETLAMKGIMNPQIAFGEDVMARITHCLMHDDGRKALQKVIVDALNDLARDLCAEAGKRSESDSPVYEPAQIVESVLVGNTAMHHLFLGLPVAQLGRAPYVAAVSSPLDVKGDELGLSFSPGATVHFLANIAGFVGADHLSMLLATDTHRKEGVVVSMDIGTNTEITLAANGRMISCSTASGPAFEGAHIRDGMRAADGAIERIRITDGKIAFQTIGHAAPIGICGSGILDALAQLRGSGALNEKGALDEGHPLVRMGEDRPEALIAGADATGTGRDIALSRADINEIQLAKGAMRAGIVLLLEAAGVTASDVDEFIIAGAFGTYISVEAARAIGMFPDIPLERFRQVGNAAGIGAKQALLSTKRRAEAAEIGQHVEYLELTVNRKFQEEFLKAMYL